MDKETLARAKELEEDIRQMEFALSYYKRGRWSHWGINDRASSFHFEFCKNYSHSSAEMQDLPTWLNKPLMEVVERELERCKHELETLGDRRKTDAVDDTDPEIITDVPEADMTGGKSKPADKLHKDSWTDKIERSFERLMSWLLYSMTFCILLGVAGLQLSTREAVAYSLMLGLVIDSINNIERVMRKLFRKED